jgi:subtilisin-like proprotein convertase family protein
VPGATRSSLIVSNVSVLDVGNYTVAVSGLCNSVTNGATLTINAPTAASPLANQTACFGQTAIFSTTPAGLGPFTFVWRKNGALVAGQSGNALTLAHVKASDAATYRVEVTGQCNSVTNSATLAVESDGLVSPATFANSNPISINDFSPGTPYPSTIEVSCVPAPISSLSVTLTNLSHSYASDVLVLLAGPSGQATMLMAHAGDGNPINGAILGFSDPALDFLPQFAPIITGAYKPTTYRLTDNMPAPAPPSPYASALSTFIGTDANGTWALYVADDNYSDIGSIAGGWSLTLNWTDPTAPIQLLSPGVLSDGCARATLQGQPGKSYVIQASTDLLTWTPILTNTLSSNLWNFVDAKSTNYSRRFYRAVAQP